MMTRRGINPIEAATIIVIMYTVMPITTVFVSTFTTTYAYMLICLILLGFIMLAGGIKRMRAIINMLFPFVLYVACTFFNRNNSFVLWGYLSMLFITPVILGYYFMYYREESAPFYAKVIIAAIIITAITTIIGVIQFPFAARVLATISASDDPENLKYSWHNIGGYNFIYTAVLLYPLLILACKLKKISRIVFLSLVITLFAMVIISEYATALILIILTSVLYFAGKKLNTGQLLILGIIVLALIFLFRPIFENALLWLANSLGSEVLSERLTALAGGYEGLENSESNRIELYRMSLNGFIQSPVFGKILGAYTSSGGHSFILDTLADYGIIGGAVIVSAYKNIYKFFFAPFRNNDGYGYVLWAFVQSIFLSTINTGMWLSVTAFFVPVLLSLIYNTNIEGNYEDSLDS